MKAPKYSIIIPVYNAEGFIQRSYLSIINQFYNDLEIIFINDGSTDNTLNVIQGIIEKNDNVKVYTQINSGPGVARNLGIKNATGDLIIFLDVDDKLNSEYFKTLDILLCNKDFKFACFGYSLVYNENQVISKFNFQKNIFINDHLKDFFEIGTIKNVVWNKVFNRNYLVENNIFFDNSRINEDAVFVFKNILNTNEILLLNANLYCHISDNINSYTNQLSIDHFKSTLNNLQKIFSLLTENNLQKLYYKSFQIYSARMLFYILFLAALKINTKKDFLLLTEIVYKSDEWARISNIYTHSLKITFIYFLLRNKHVLWFLSLILKKINYSIQ
jgi:glycosyltransferase involved in cell wall biosynthesis